MPSIALPVSLRGQLLYSTRIFDPVSLFAANEPGVWYDPSDLTTLFQDTAGTTLVTTPGQTVALALDKSRGLVPSSELLPTLNFNNWTARAGGTNTVVSNNSFSVTAEGGRSIAFVVQTGKYYEVQLQAVSSGPVATFHNSINVGTNIRATINGSLQTFRFAALTPDIAFRLASAGTLTVSSLSVKEIPGFHATQATLASRPTYQVDGNGKAYLSFDGVDDFMITPTITPGIDKVQVFAGVRKLSDAAAGVLAEFSASWIGNIGSFILTAPGTTAPSGNYDSASRGNIAFSANQGAATGTIAAPVTNVITATHDIAGDLTAVRSNGVQLGTATGDKGTGNFLAYPLYIGRRGGTTLPFNGQIYSLIARFGTNLDAGTITSTEAWVAGKTGVTL